MFYANYIFCVFLLICLVFQAMIIFKRNKKIIIRGERNTLIFTLAVCSLLYLFPIVQISKIEMVRNVLLLIVVMASSGIKQGFSEKGMEGIFYAIPWNAIKQIEIKSHQPAKIAVVCQSERTKHRLILPQSYLSKIMNFFDEYVKNEETIIKNELS